MKNALKIAGVLALALSIVIQIGYQDKSVPESPSEADPEIVNIPLNANSRMQDTVPNPRALKRIKPLNSATKYTSILPDCGKVEPEDNIAHLACNVFWEARGEDLPSKISVAILTVNRVEHEYYPETVHSVVWERRPGPQFSWTKDGKSDQIPESERDAWMESIWVARLVWAAFNDPNFQIQVGDVDLTHATHYHAEYVHPRWAKKMVRIGQIGSHIFYCDPQINQCSDNT